MIPLESQRKKKIQKSPARPCKYYQFDQTLKAPSSKIKHAIESALMIEYILACNSHHSGKHSPVDQLFTILFQLFQLQCNVWPFWQEGLIMCYS